MTAAKLATKPSAGPSLQISASKCLVVSLQAGASKFRKNLFSSRSALDEPRAAYSCQRTLSDRDWGTFAGLN